MVSVRARVPVSIVPFLSMFQYAVDLTSLFSSNLSPFSTSKVRRKFSDKSSLLGYQVIYYSEINYAENKRLHNNGHLLCYIVSVSHEFGSSLAKWPGLAFFIRMLPKCWSEMLSSEGLLGLEDLLPK